MQIELPEQLEVALKLRANSRGVSATGYVQEMLERDLRAVSQDEATKPFRTSRGQFAKYGAAPSEEEIAANRLEMFKKFGERF